MQLPPRTFEGGNGPSILQRGLVFLQSPPIALQMRLCKAGVGMNPPLPPPAQKGSGIYLGPSRISRLSGVWDTSRGQCQKYAMMLTWICHPLQIHEALSPSRCLHLLLGFNKATLDRLWLDGPEIWAQVHLRPSSSLAHCPAGLDLLWPGMVP
jgi:hypothetical protein